MASHSRSDVPQIHEHTQGDVASPTTAPLLNFLLNFTDPDTSYGNTVQNTPGHDLWSIGNEAPTVVPFRGRSGLAAQPERASRGEAEEDDKIKAEERERKEAEIDYGEAAEEDEIPDESVQDQKTYMDMINGPGLPGIPAGTSVRWIETCSS